MSETRDRLNPIQEACTLSSGPILCRGVGCMIRFLPKRKDQTFCSLFCRVEFFAIARTVGTLLLDRGKKDPKISTLIRDLLKGRM